MSKLAWVSDDKISRPFKNMRVVEYFTIDTYRCLFCYKSNNSIGIINSFQISFYNLLCVKIWVINAFLSRVYILYILSFSSIIKRIDQFYIKFFLHFQFFYPNPISIKNRMCKI